MIVELRIPEVGESITEVQIAGWLKSEGDTVARDESVATIDSEKTTFELPAPESGRLVKILHPAGETVVVGEVIGHLETGEGAGADLIGRPADSLPSLAGSEAHALPARDASAGPDEPPPAAANPEERPARSPASAGDSPVAPPSQTGSEPDDREGGPAGEGPGSPAGDRKPPAAPSDGAPAPAVPTAGPSGEAAGDTGEEVRPMTMLRRTVARRLVEAHQTMAALTTFNEVDMTEVQSLRREHQEAFQKRYGIRLGLMSFFVKAAIEALKQVPALNAEIRGNDIVYHHRFDLGVAVATDRGLVVPVLRRAERLSFAEVEKAMGELARKGREGRLLPADLEGGTFTLTNGGVFGSLLSTPLINPPQSGVLGLHSIQDRPVARHGQVRIRPLMYLALTYDHRLVDGREAVLFLRRIKETVESPARLLLEI